MLSAEIAQTFGFENPKEFQLANELVGVAPRITDTQQVNGKPRGMFYKYFSDLNGVVKEERWNAFLSNLDELAEVIKGYNEKTGQYTRPNAQQQFEWWINNLETHGDALGLEYYAQNYLKMDSSDVEGYDYDFQRKELVVLTLEREPCDSCKQMIKLFKELFPNIHIIVTYMWSRDNKPNFGPNGDFVLNSGQLKDLKKWYGNIIPQIF